MVKEISTQGAYAAYMEFMREEYGIERGANEQALRQAALEDKADRELDRMREERWERSKR